MVNFQEEILNYQLVSVYAKATLEKYTKCLVEFNEYLAHKLSCPSSEVELDKIFTIKSGDIIIGYKPIDSKVIDTYLFDLVGDNYSKLATATHAIRSFFKYLKRNKIFPDVIAHSDFSLSTYKPKFKPIRILSRHEFLRFLHSMVSHSQDLVRDTLLFGLLFSTGCRISEILNINVSELDLTNEMILLIKTKTKVQRVVVLREGFGEILREYLDRYRNNKSVFLFPGAEPNKPISRTEVNSHFQNYLAKANLPSMHIHSSRHSFATFMRDEGVDLFTLMELLGHEKFQSTLHYTRHYTRNKNIKIKQHEEVYSHLRGILKKIDK
ncbi:tyrosine-type recombinase/integrase [Paenibacillus phytohabitans]|uniref:tyrosine-type recombinase/integrase n=1 Tax=Paenibacillus phytohabitans TaxID=2654978 RepID=UPI00300B4A07